MINLKTKEALLFVSHNLSDKVCPDKYIIGALQDALHFGEETQEELVFKKLVKNKIQYYRPRIIRDNPELFI
jgi:hypothetical protein